LRADAEYNHGQPLDTVQNCRKI